MMSGEDEYYCRFCANLKPRNISKFIDFNDSKTLKMHRNLLSSLNFDFINWDDKSLPKTVCNQCWQAMRRCFKFYELARKSQKVLQKIIKIKNESKFLNVKEENPDLCHPPNTSEYVECAPSGNSQDHIILIPEVHFKSEVAIKPEPIPLADCEYDFDIDVTVNKTSASSSPDSRSNSTSIVVQNSHIVSDTSIAHISKAHGRKKPIQRLKPMKKVIMGQNSSWLDYGWECLHCKENCDSMEKLREHSQVIHSVCYGFKCNECDNEYNIFNNFVEHVRQHREYLRYYCQHCNEKFKDQMECSAHSVTHWDESYICALCGEMFSDPNALKRHNVVFKRRRLQTKHTRKAIKIIDCDKSLSWEDYEWKCFYCYYVAANVEELREHSKRIHKLCFTMKCADCLNIFTHFNVLITHVRKHRPTLMNYCQYCNYHCEDLTQLDLHITLTHPKFCITCGECFMDEQLYFLHMKEYDVRISTTTPKEDLVCKLCNKAFEKPMYLKKHFALHKERTKDYTCDECGSSFFKIDSLQAHMQTHKRLKVPCLICKKFIKHTTFKNHVKAHFLGKNFSCDTCGKNFRTKANLKDHMRVHSDEANLKCEYCSKGFKRLTTLKTHLVQHTGEKPYACKVCDKSFGNWSNCNKHMLRKHNVSLGKTKQTEIGTVRINEATGEVEVPSCDDIEVKQWANQALEKKSTKLGRPKRMIT